MKKVTEFKGQASGDCECFCFDRREGNINPHEGSYQDRDAARIYPGELLPTGADGVFGTWRITVEFTPDCAE
jgi:hypothetical protein